MDERHLKVHIWKAAPPAEGPVDLQDGLVVFVGDEEFRGEGVPLLEDVAHRVTRGRLDLQLRRRGVLLGWGGTLTKRPPGGSSPDASGSNHCGD